MVSNKNFETSSWIESINIYSFNYWKINSSKI